MWTICLPHKVPFLKLPFYASFPKSGHPLTPIFKCLNLNKIVDGGEEHKQIRSWSSLSTRKESFAVLFKKKTKTKIKTLKRKKIVLIYYSCYSERSGRKQNQQLICQAEKMQSLCWLLWSSRLFYGGSLSNSIHFTWLQIP